MESFKLRTKNAVKKMAVLGGAMALAASFITPALAAGLADLPAPFVADGEMVSTIVVGESAATIDVAGAIDIGAAFAQRATTTQMVGGVSDQITYPGAAELADIGDDLNWNEAFDVVKKEFDYTDMDMLAKGKATNIKENTDYSYEQTMYFEAGLNPLVFGNPDNLVFNKPIVYLDIVGPTGPTNYLYEMKIDFLKDLKLGTAGLKTDWVNSEDIVFFGKTLTFSPNNEDTKDIIMYAATDTTYLELGETTVIDGNSLSIVGGNSAGPTGILRINGEQRTVAEGETYTIGGVKVYVKDLYVTDIPELSVSATVFVGSDEYNLGVAGAVSKALKINGNDVDGVEVEVAGAWDAVTEIVFTVSPVNADIEYIAMGAAMEDLVFGTFKVDFVGVEPGLIDTTKTSIMFRTSGKNYETTFTNLRGETYKITPFQVDSALGLQQHTDFIADNTVDMVRNNVFVATFGGGDVARAYKVRSVYVQDGTDYVDFQDLSSGEVITRKAGQFLGDHDVTTITTGLGASLNWVKLGTSPFATEAGVGIQTEYKQVLSFNFVTNEATIDEAGMTFQETAYIANALSDLTVEFIDNSGTLEIKPSTITTDIALEIDEADKVGYFLSPVGTYVVADADSYRYINVHLPEQEADYKLYIAPTGATASVATGGMVESHSVNYITPGVGVLDRDVNTATLNNPIILVGGPAVNTLVADLIAAEKATPATEYSEDMAMIELVENAFGNNAALIVAGWDGKDTRLASRALANTIVGGPNALALTGNKVALNTGVVGYSQVTLQ